jgi:hypothetical protein
MAITLRTVTGSALSFLQVDENFSSYYYSASIAGTTITLFRTGSNSIGVPPSSSSIVLPSTSKWSDSAGGIRRDSLVKVVGPFAQGASNTSATGLNSHAQGDSTVASATGSHAEGLGTVASGSYQHVQGQYNLSSSVESAFIIGNGTSNTSRSNLVFASGSQFQVTGSLNVNGAINTVGNLTVQGNITAQQYIVSTSIYYVTESYNSGSHIFGNSLDDTHQFTGSVLITGSLNVSGSTTTTGTTTTNGINIGGLTTLSNDGFNLYNTNGNITFYRNQCQLQFIIGNDDVPAPIQIASTNTLGLQISSSGYLHLSASVVGVNDILRLTPRSTTPTPVEGMIIASGSAGASILYYYNGTSWNALF